jgi:hypothetical protein
VLSSLSKQVELGWLFTVSELVEVISKELMVTQMVSFQCSKSIMKQPDMLTRVVERERVHLLSTWNHGTLISLISCNSKRIMVKRNKEPEISSMPYGYQISSCREF